MGDYRFRSLTPSGREELLTVERLSNSFDKLFKKNLRPFAFLETVLFGGPILKGSGRVLVWKVCSIDSGNMGSPDGR